MVYGSEKYFVFPKKMAYDLVTAIYGKEQLESIKMSKENFDFLVGKTDIVEVLNNKCSGKGFVMITKFKNAIEYINGCQNEFVGITGLDFDGSLIAKTNKELFTKGIANYDTSEYRELSKEDLDEFLLVA